MADLRPGRWLRQIYAQSSLNRLSPRRRWRVVVRVEEADQVPTRLPRRGAALAGPAGAPKWLALDCPCGTGHRLLVNIDSRRRPAWRLVSARPLTVKPSIDIIHDGVQCHFTITSGTVRWTEPEWAPGSERR